MSAVSRILRLYHTSLKTAAIQNKNTVVSLCLSTVDIECQMLSMMRVLLVLMAFNLLLNMPVLELKNKKGKSPTRLLFSHQKVALLRERLRIKKLARWNEKTKAGIF